ncbi:MAG: DUF1080 domain-containing protein, partial [Phycisphaerales bacterium]
MTRRTFADLLGTLMLFAAVGTVRAEASGNGWVSLFDGKTLNGWKASENADSFSVRNGVIVASGPPSHLFYIGPIENAIFTDFELMVDV